ncbi:hypothetical protein ACVBEH_14080 [Roseateles sp. GG27B]
MLELQIGLGSNGLGSHCVDLRLGLTDIDDRHVADSELSPRSSILLVSGDLLSAYNAKTSRA